MREGVPFPFGEAVPVFSSSASDARRKEGPGQAQALHFIAKAGVLGRTGQLQGSLEAPKWRGPQTVDPY